jgi:hypothetical protein
MAPEVETPVVSNSDTAGCAGCGSEHDCENRSKAKSTTVGNTAEYVRFLRGEYSIFTNEGLNRKQWVYSKVQVFNNTGNMPLEKML